MVLNGFNELFKDFTTTIDLITNYDKLLLIIFVYKISLHFKEFWFSINKKDEIFSSIPEDENSI